MTDRARLVRPSVLAALIAAVLLVRPAQSFGEDEVCGTCGPPVTLTGEFTHSKDAPQTGAVEGAGDDAPLYREDVNGKAFTISVATLPPGKYTVTIGMAENNPQASAGERVFAITSNDGAIIAKDVDIVAAAGAPRKVTKITGTVDHLDDSLRGPLKLVFEASKGTAKFNTIEVRNAAGEPVVAFAASELADAFSAAAAKVPDVEESAFWRDASRPMEERIRDLIRRMSLAEKVAQLRNAAPAVKRLGLPAYDYWNEALHGVANNGIATVFPEPIGGAASWNPSLFRAQGHVIGVEGRAKHNDYASKNNGDSKWWAGLTFWTPNINIFRDPRWGRGQETYGEDPHLTSEIGIEFVRGIQGDDPNYMLAMACAKHYAVHSGPEADRHRFNAVADERDLYETYLPQFERVVKEGKVAGVMSAYNAINGVPASASEFLLTDVLRTQWGFSGYVVSDCDAIRDIWGPRFHEYVGTPEEAAAVAVKAGTNLCCGGDYNALVRAVQKELITEREIDQALYHTLWTRFRMGLFDPPDKVPFSKITLADNDTPQNRQVSLELARQSIVLLKNSGILPLQAGKYKRIAVVGPNANSRTMLEGNYHGSASNPVTILAGIREQAGPGVEVTYDIGSPITPDRRTAPWSGQDNATSRPVNELSQEALANARDADLIIYVGGITAGQEGESFDRSAIELPEVQGNLIKALHATGKPVVMVNCSGSAIALPWEDENLPAIVQAWYPGGDGGRAVGEVLFGKVNPSGHLPITFYRATSDLPSFTDYSMTNRTYRYFTGKPLWAFGHGLSYTTFEYSNATLASESIAANGTVKLSFTIKNTGDRDGADVAQVYYRRVDSKVEQPKQSLCAFQRVEVKAGESKDVTIEIPSQRLRYWDEQNDKYIVEAGKYELNLAAASDDIRVKVPFTVK